MPSPARFLRCGAALFLLLLGPTTALAQDDETCLDCHGIDGLTAERGGRSFSIYVDEERFEHSVHAVLDCVVCHADLAGVDGYPHASPLERVDCTSCHDDDDGPIAAFRGGSHGLALAAGNGLAPNCQDCHGGHDIAPVHGADAAMEGPRLNALCTRCHTDVAGAPPGSVHASAFAGRTCLACHDAHAAKPPAPLAGDESCLLCHDGVQADEPAAGPGPPAAPGSVHDRAGIGCVLCHADLRDLEDPIHGDVAPVNCATCHAEAQAAYARGVHSGTMGNGHVAADCTDCHGTHDIQSAADPRSRVFPLRLPDTCEACHRPEPPLEHPAPAGERVQQYETSIHGRALREGGLVVTATCKSCHGSHEIRHAGDPAAPTSRALVPYTCGSCHAGYLNDYLSGVHGEGFLRDETTVPVCTDCHGEHTIDGPTAGTSSVASKNVAETCARCHADDALANDFGFVATSLRSWQRSYHGIASSFGSGRAANCASCHGFHAIFPSSDPRSKVNPANLEETCGSCHVGVRASFAKVPVHTEIDRDSNFIPWIVLVVYTVVVVVTIGAFILFILVDLFGRLRMRLGWGPGETVQVDPEVWPDEGELVKPEESFKRMSLHARLQHGVLVTSFMLLVLTGLPVFLHELPLMHAIMNSEGALRLRSLLHRGAALGLIGLSGWHIVSLFVSPGGRRWLRSMVFRWADIRNFLAEFMFNLGLMDWLARRRPLRAFFERHPAWRFDRRPIVGRYGLVEKLEYYAVVWGNVVMILSGAILWRPDWFLGALPTWTFDVARVVHGYEATLAFLAIIIWHMYHVHFRPGVFPGSKTWYDGKISRHELRHHHPGEYLEILKRRRAARTRPPS